MYFFILSSTPTKEQPVVISKDNPLNCELHLSAGAAAIDSLLYGGEGNRRADYASASQQQAIVTLVKKMNQVLEKVEKIDKNVEKLSAKLEEEQNAMKVKLQNFRELCAKLIREPSLLSATNVCTVGIESHMSSLCGKNHFTFFPIIATKMVCALFQL